MKLLVSGHYDGEWYPAWTDVPTVQAECMHLMANMFENPEYLHNVRIWAHNPPSQHPTPGDNQ